MTRYEKKQDASGLAHQMQQAVQLHQAGRLPEAEVIYRQVLALAPDHIDALRLMGAATLQQGRSHEAKGWIEQALSLNPDLVEEQYHLGLAWAGLGDGVRAESAFRRALQLQGDFVPAWGGLGDLYRAAGALFEARDAYLEALSLQPNQWAVLSNLGSVHQGLGDFEAAIECFRKVLVQDPHQMAAHFNLGNALRAIAHPEAAIAHYRKAETLAPDLAAIPNNLGHVLWEVGALQEAETVLCRALALAPNDAEIHNNLAAVYTDLRQLEAAKRHAQQALAISPEYAAAHSNLGSILRELGDHEEALTHHQRALALAPEIPQYLNNMGTALRELGRLDEAAHHLRQALLLDPEYAAAHSNLASVYRDQGRMEQARVLYEKGLRLKSDFGMVKNLITTLLHLPGLPLDALYQAAERYVTRCIEPSCSVQAGQNAAGDWCSESPVKARLKIGYLSSDFRQHPVGHNILPLLMHHDPNKVELFCYAELPSGSDDMTARFQSVAHHWRATEGLTDAQVAEQIRSDRVDIMVYLAGLFDANRVLIAAYGPAPVQVSFHNGTSTALKAMDYWLTDGYLHPTGQSREQFSERLVRLPNFYCYPGVHDAPEPGTPPVDENGYVTFGSFNNPAKINSVVIALWSKILRALPAARLMLKYRHLLGDAGLRRRVIEQFSEHGVEAKRLILPSAKESFRAHMARYHQMDIALDPFPFNGATTTFQALWMGVPVVTLAGEGFISRAAGSMVRHVAPDLVVQDERAYVAQAVALAGNSMRLRSLRGSLRSSLLNSPLCDGPGYARSIESAFQEMWRAHVAQKHGAQEQDMERS
ncbi:MAG: tetratricopeptide repeat protein [Magnetococcales bacterium]|nr:tetratricopeptide repeat protein [Magnetococcales bacterium]